MDQPPVTLLGRDDCVRTAEIRALLVTLGVRFTYVPLEGLTTPGNPCGYVSPTLILGAEPSEPLVQPSTAAVLDALALHGLLRRRRDRAGRRRGLLTAPL